jgi:hypothetical protein
LKSWDAEDVNEPSSYEAVGISITVREFWGYGREDEAEAGLV